MTVPTCKRWLRRLMPLCVVGLAASTQFAERAEAEDVRKATSAPTEALQARKGPEPAARALVRTHWQPAVTELRGRLEELKQQAPDSREATRRISQLERRVGAIEQHMARAAAQLETMRTTRAARREHRVASLQQAWGAAALQKTAVRAELATHARRAARLKQAERVAQNVGAPDSERRARELLQREQTRHERQMRKLIESRPSAVAPSPASSLEQQ